MTLLELKKHLEEVDQINFVLPTGDMVPSHFHVTEIGQVNKHFIDCGGTIRHESIINFQLWTADDYDHRLSVQKLAAIIKIAEQKLGLSNGEIEVEYQAETIGKYQLEFSDGKFKLIPTQTDCLAKNQCGIPTKKPKIKLASLSSSACCDPESGCC